MKSTEHPLAPHSGPPESTTRAIAGTSANACDPYQQLRELMVVIEELCPTWPERETFAGYRIFLL
jgi:hypothetical protein